MAYSDHLLKHIMLSMIAALIIRCCPVFQVLFNGLKKIIRHSYWLSLSGQQMVLQCLK